MPTDGWVSFCPCNDQCKKGGKRLGWDETDEQARQRIVQHLTNSSYHLMDEMLAQGTALAAELFAEVEPDEPPVQEKVKGKGKGWNAGKQAWSSSSSWSDGDWKQKDGWQDNRSQPYPAVPVPAQSIVQVRTTADPSQRDKLIVAISKAEAGCRAASRMARQAFQAFEDEANVLREALDALRG